MPLEIKLKRPTTCNHCSAYADSYCRLGYKTKKVSIEDDKIWRYFNTWTDATIKIKPDEPCPKPKNNKEVSEISKQIDVHRYGHTNSKEYKSLKIN